MVVAAPRLLLNEESHAYTLDGRPIRSVTQILGDVGIIDTTWFTPEAALRGKYVHEATHYHDEGSLEMGSLDPAISPYVQGWIDFRKMTGFRPLLMEQRVWHSSGYAGTLDRFGLIGSRPILIDIKSGSLPSWAGLQTSGYEFALVERILAKEIDVPMPQGRMAVQLTREGKFKVKEYTNFRDRDIFLAAHAVSQWQMAA
jgi:hypothetical protein